MIEGGGRDGSVAIFTLPSVCMVEMLQVQFQALYLLLAMQPTNYCVPHLQNMWLTLQMDGTVTVNSSCNPDRINLTLLSEIYLI